MVRLHLCLGETVQEGTVIHVFLRTADLRVAKKLLFLFLKL